MVLCKRRSGLRHRLRDHDGTHRRRIDPPSTFATAQAHRFDSLASGERPETKDQRPSYRPPRLPIGKSTSEKSENNSHPRLFNASRPPASRSTIASTVSTTNPPARKRSIAFTDAPPVVTTSSTTATRAPTGTA